MITLKLRYQRGIGTQRGNPERDNIFQPEVNPGLLKAKVSVQPMVESGPPEPKVSVHQEVNSEWDKPMLKPEVNPGFLKAKVSARYWYTQM